MKRVATHDAIFAFSSHNIYAIKELYSFKMPKNVFTIPQELKRIKKLKALNSDYKTVQNKLFTTFNDGAHDFNLEVMYVNAKWQVSELVSLGLKDISVLSLSSGKEIALSDITEKTIDPWLYYVCKVFKE
jgi:hypothetical protein